MTSPANTIESLIYQEQALQGGKFIAKNELNQYIGKIKNKSEIISHNIDGDCAGFVSFYCNDLASREAYITLVLTNPRFRGMHIAKNLVQAALASAKRRGFKTCALEVRNDNAAAIRLYASLGFSDYERTETSRIMKVSLP